MLGDYSTAGLKRSFGLWSGYNYQDISFGVSCLDPSL